MWREARSSWSGHVDFPVHPTRIRAEVRGVTMDPRARIEALERENAALRADNALLRAENAKLVVRIEALEERLRTNSSNSSQPPSSDGPGGAPAKPKPTFVPSGKKRGGQKGHKKHQRELVPPEQVDHHHECKPGACSGCGARLSGSDPSPLLHQTLTLPEVKPIVDQYALHALTCDGCGTTTRAQLPERVSPHLLTASVVAVVALLMGAHRMSKRCVQSLLSDLYGLRVSLGAIVDAQIRASEALASAVEQAQEHVQAAPVKHADETGWHCSAKRAWLWLMATKQVAVSKIAADRSSAAARELLGACRGVLVTDRFSGYGWWVLRYRQVCWAHLLRDFVKIAERGGESARIGEDLLGRVKYLFEWWSELKAGTIVWTTFRARVSVFNLKGPATG
jgi:transposase